MAETLRQRLVRGYSYSIYIDGTRTLATTNESYHEEIKQYAAFNFTNEQLDNALIKGFITQKEYDDTISYKYPSQSEAPAE
jgi:hypothetical protein